MKVVKRIARAHQHVFLKLASLLKRADCNKRTNIRKTEIVSCMRFQNLQSPCGAASELNTATIVNLKA